MFTLLFMMVPFSRITFGEKVSDLVLLEACCFPADRGLFKEIFPQQPTATTDWRPSWKRALFHGAIKHLFISRAAANSLTRSRGRCSELGKGRARQAHGRDGHKKDNEFIRISVLCVCEHKQACVCVLGNAVVRVFFYPWMGDCLAP